MAKQKNNEKKIIVAALAVIVLVAVYISLRQFIPRLSSYKQPETREQEVSLQDLSKLTFVWSSISDVDVSILHPSDFPLIKKTMTGVIAYYEFQRTNKSKWNSFFLNGLFLGNRKSIAAKVAGCSLREIQCSQDELSAVNTFDNLLANFRLKNNFKDYFLTTLGGQNYFIRESKCSGDSCFIREYITFKGSLEISIGTFWWKNEANREKLDKVISQMVIR